MVFKFKKCKTYSAALNCSTHLPVVPQLVANGADSRSTDHQIRCRSAVPYHPATKEYRSELL